MESTTMSRMTWDEKRANYECDGCGYVFSKSVLEGSIEDQTYEAPINLSWRGRVYHFHDALDHGYPCFKYWLENKAERGSADMLAALLGSTKSD